METVLEERPVGQPGQRVVEGLEGQPLLEPLPVGDVPEAPHPPDDRAVDRLWLRDALEDPAVLEFEHVAALRPVHLVDLFHLGDELGGTGQLVADVGGERRAIGALEDRLGDLPHLGEALVEADHPPVGPDHQDAVGGGVEGRLQQGERRPQLEIGRPPLGDVVAGDDVPADRRVVHQVHEGELEGEGLLVPVADEGDGHRHRTGHRGAARRPFERPFEILTVGLGHQVGKRLTLDELRVVAELPRDRPGHGLDAAVRRHEHGDRRRVVDEGAEPGVVVVHQLEAPPLGDVSDGQEHGTVLQPGDR